MTESELLRQKIVNMTPAEFATWIDERASEDYDAGFQDGQDRGYNNGYDDGYAEGSGE